MAAKKKVNARKKPASRKKKRPPKKQKPSIFKELKKVFVGIAVLLSVCLTVAMILDILLEPKHVKKHVQKVQKETSVPLKIEPVQEEIVPVKNKQPVKGLKEKNGEGIKYEVFDDVDHSVVEKPEPPVKDLAPKIVIIIDDIGYDRKIALALADLHENITFSVLPFSPFGRKLSEKLHSRGAQLMLHLPMEPVEYPKINPGPGAILASMPPDVLLNQLKKSIDDVPHIVGVNNHMGSRLTAEANQMNQIFTILKKENLFFIDSRTAPKSQGKAAARLFQLEFAQRDIFLDNFQDVDYITGQFNKLVRMAKKHGSAIGIGHPYKATLETLAIELPKLKGKVKIVRASTLASVPG